MPRGMLRHAVWEDRCSSAGQGGEWRAESGGRWPWHRLHAVGGM